jgi:peroxiredoxin
MAQDQPLARSLDVLRNRSAEWRSLYDTLVSRLRQLGVGTNAPVRGEPFPNIRLPDSRGAYRSIEELSNGGPLVLSFNRGRWCPYCRAELEHWRTVLPAIAAEGASFAVITPEVGGKARELADLAGPDIPVLCDVDNGLALTLGLAFYAGDALVAEYQTCGTDLPSFYGNDSHILPVPATFLITPDGAVDFAYVDPDFRSRAEPVDVAARLAALRS